MSPVQHEKIKLSIYELKDILNEKKRVFASGSLQNRKRYAKEDFMDDAASLVLANNLNEHFTRFEINDNDNISAWQQSVMNDAGMESTLIIKKEMVQQVFERTNVRKSPGPDNIEGRVLKYCAAQLSGIFCSLFQRSVNTQVVPLLWKTTVVNPLPKVSHPSSSKDYRPIALTSLLVKSLEQIIKTHIMNSCRHALDPLQFAYRLGRGTDDAICSAFKLSVYTPGGL